MNKITKYILLDAINLTRYIIFIALVLSGVQLKNVVFAQTLYYVVNMVGEVPLGYISDKYRQKSVLVFSNIIMIVSCICYLIMFSVNITLFLYIAVLLDSFARTLKSGTYESFILNEYNKLNNVKGYSEYIKRTNYYCNLLQILAILYLLFSKNLSILITAFTIQIVIKVIVIVILMLDFGRTEIIHYEQEKYHKKDIINFLRYKNIKILIPFILLVSVINVEMQFLPLYFNEITNSVFICFFFFFLAVFSSLIVVKITKLRLIKYMLVFNLFNLLLNVPLEVFIISNLFFVAEIMYYYIYPLINEYINTNKGDRKAVYFSLISNISSIISILIVQVIGLDKINITVLLISILLIVIVINFLDILLVNKRTINIVK